MNIWVCTNNIQVPSVSHTVECVHIQNHSALSLDRGPLQLSGGIESGSWSRVLQRGQQLVLAE